MCAIIHVCLYVHMNTLPSGVRIGHKTPLELELKIVLRCPMLVLRTKLKSSASAVCALNYGASSPALKKKMPFAKLQS